MMRDRMEIIYGDEKSRSKFAIQSLSEVSAGVGCVAFNKALGAYVRVRVISMSPKQAEVAPIDTPTLGIFFVGKDEIFRVPTSLAFPRQVYECIFRLIIKSIFSALLSACVATLRVTFVLACLSLLVV